MEKGIVGMPTPGSKAGRGLEWGLLPVPEGPPPLLLEP